MKKLTIKDVGIALMMFAYISLIALGLMSCGARKVEKDVAREETKSETIISTNEDGLIDTNVKATTTIKLDDKNETITEETVYEAIDPTKEAVFIDEKGNKTVLGNFKKTVKKTTQKNNTQYETNSNSETNKKEAVKKQKLAKSSSNTSSYKKSSKIEREEVSMWNWLWLLIPIGVLVWLFRKYRDKIWWV